jgi:hypothetical protein
MWNFAIAEMATFNAVPPIEHIFVLEIVAA